MKNLTTKAKAIDHALVLVLWWHYNGYVARGKWRQAAETLDDLETLLGFARYRPRARVVRIIRDNASDRTTHES
jgi:hypothetical protein